MKLSLSRRTRMIAIAGAGLLAASLVVVAEITASGDLWRLALGAQLQTDKRCNLEKVISSRKFEVGGVKALEGRIRCIDGREFNFSQAAPHLKFKLGLCTPATC